MLSPDGRWLEVEAVRLRDDTALTATYNLEVETEHVFFVGKCQVLVHNGDTDDVVYESPKGMPGQKLTGVDKEHAIPKVAGKNNPTIKQQVDSPDNLRPMEAASNRIDKQRLDVESTNRLNQLKLDLEKTGMSPAQAEAHAWKAMEGEFRANANSQPAFPTDQIDNLCPK
ncbi:MAG: hypothetical protein AAGK14_15550 [Verrucomicrobiota bacterium]